jgi:hypothetical protein
MRLTPAQKAAQTRQYNKAWQKLQDNTEASVKVFYDFCETLYPERDRIIDEAEAERFRVIAEAEAKCAAIIESEMAKFNDAILPAATERQRIYDLHYKIFLQERDNSNATL